MGSERLSAERKSEPAPQLCRPPGLGGYSFSGDQAYAARQAGRLLSIRLETNRSCNLKCLYCYARGGEKCQGELDYGQLVSVVRQAAGLGAESVVVIGGGEPTLYGRFRELIDVIVGLDMRAVVFSNTVAVDRGLARFLRDRDVSVMGKLDSLDLRLQDYLAGVEGSAKRIRAGLDNLLEAGFGDIDSGDQHRLGVSFVSNRLNIDEVEDIWRWCRQRNIFPNMEILTPTGRANDFLNDFALELDEIARYKLRLLEIDRVEFGYDWLVYTPLAASGCMQHLYSMYITITGDVRPCAPTKFDEHPDMRQGGVYPYNVRRMNLRQIYDANVFEYVRNIDRYLEGKCRDCRHGGECIGCRGYAYAVGTNAGKGPREALRGQCLQCWK